MAADRRVRLHWEIREAETLFRQGVDDFDFAIWLLRRIALDQAELIELDRAAAVELAATAELAELDAADRRQPRARQPWQHAPTARMRTKRQRMAWTGTRPAGYGSDPGRR